MRYQAEFYRANSEKFENDFFTSSLKKLSEQLPNDRMHDDRQQRGGFLSIDIRLKLVANLKDIPPHVGGR